MKKKSKLKIPRPELVLTICKDCRIRLVVPAANADKCSLCQSPNITKESWKRN